MIIDLDGNGSKIKFFQDLLADAETSGDRIFAKMRQSLRQYKGSKEIDPSNDDGIDDDDELFASNAKQIRNVTYELIESEASSYIPNPSVTPQVKSDRNERCAKSIETLLKNIRNRLPFEKMNDMDERYTPVYGGSVWLIEWDDGIVTHNSVGDVKISCLSPMHFVGQPNIYEVQDMDYCFIKFDTTVEDIERKYDVTIEGKAELDLDSETTAGNDKGTATVIVCYYKNEDDKVCEYIWSGDTELRDVDDYFARKHKVCKKCGKRKEICTCENTRESDYVYENDEYEELDAPIVTTDGVIPALSPVIEDGVVQTKTTTQPALDEQGQMIMDTSSGLTLPAMIDVQVPKTEKTKLPYYQPSLFPIVIRKNISQEDCLFGQSDCEFVRPQQMGINKVESRIIDKLMRAGVYFTYPDNGEGVKDLDNDIYGTGIPVNQGNINLYKSLDMQIDISQDIAEADRLYDQAKRILGISDSFQGQHDASAQSGIAKQLQINQSAGRLDSKKKMKNAAYAEMDRVIFELYLAYADEPRPAVYKDAWGNLQNEDFNRYDFLAKDENGEYYYDDRFLFATDATIDVEAAREVLWQENRQNFQTGAYGNPADPNAQLTFWLNMEMTHYPFAHDNVERLRDQIQSMQQAQQQQMMMQNQMVGMQADAVDKAKQENEVLKRIAGGITNESVQ